MPEGLQLWDGAGNTLLDTTTGITTRLRSVWSGTTPGSIVVPEFALGRPWYFCLYAATPGGTSQGFGAPELGHSGTTLFWNWNNMITQWGAQPGPSQIFYGIY